MDEETPQSLKEIIRQIVSENPMGIDKRKPAQEALGHLNRKVQ